ncbi:solute symporter family protein [Orientia chuto str. Dubai]|uniref:Solute symporter family protein n=1 Tax=Orientia chuto str. Dubai TaxID=1359168 RepID=A0A0F3MKG4_9RICK|nr:sodium:pantothenate symporter [Candidatus Orientia mediorientalis]KJV55069.1 solute symporter family protein [Orientia chuto str. Dubai]
MITKLIIITYLLLTIGVSIYYRAKFHSLDDFGAAKMSKTINNKFLLVIAILTTSIGGGTILGIAEKVLISNSLVWSYGLLLSVVVDVIIALLVMPQFSYNNRFCSIGDIAYKHYGNYGRIIAGIGAVSASIGYLTTQIIVSGRIFEFIFGIKYSESLILSYLIIIIYTAVEGSKAIIATYLLRFIAMILIIVVVPTIGSYKLGIYNIVNQILPKYALYNSELILSTIKIALCFSIIGFHPSLIQKLLANNNSATTIKHALIIKSCLYAFFIICITINGLIAFCIMLPQDTATPILVILNSFFSPLFKGILLVGLLSIVITTAQSNLSVISISMINDIINPLTNISKPAVSFLLTQVITILTGSISICIALNFYSVVDLIIFMNGFWSAPLLVPIILGLFNIKISTKAFICNSILGLATFIIWEYYNLFSVFSISGGVIGTTINFLFFILIYLFNLRNGKLVIRYSN